MKKSLLLAEFAQTPWALHPAALAKLSGVLANWSNGVHPSAEVMSAIQADKEAREARRNVAAQASGGGIAVLPMYGIITQRGNMADDICGPGSVSTQQFTRALREAINDPMIAQVLIDVDSPGGSVYGCQELADEIHRARAAKPIIGVANSLAASAAYWICSQCSEFYCTPSGEVGSIGVYTAHADYSAMLEMEGVKMTLIQAGDFKTEGNPYGPLTDEAKANIQKSVNGYYATFTQSVAKGRGCPVAKVRDDMGKGRCLSASDAMAAGMIDGIATFDEVVAKMQKSIRAGRGASAEDIAPGITAETAQQPAFAARLAEANRRLRMA